jgi:hypothetical protein
MSIFLAGGGLKMGQVMGATNATREEPSRRTININYLLAMIYQRFGIDVHHIYHDRTRRPLPILQWAGPSQLCCNGLRAVYVLVAIRYTNGP